MEKNSAKQLLEQYCQARYQAFKLNSDNTLNLPTVSSVPGIAGSERRDVYRKKIVAPEPNATHHIKFITKNDNPHHFVWQTDAKTLKKAVRWGIVKTHSITGNVISALGRYNVVATNRIAKGMVSNSAAFKSKLLNLYQSRFEALQSIESMVNKPNSVEDYQRVFDAYISELTSIKENLPQQLNDIDCPGFTESIRLQIKDDIDADILRAQQYKQSIMKRGNTSAFNQARGQDSALEFVKEQMTHGLYELQGINQDVSYSRRRPFALTRGELNDFIEDARKVINDHQADPCNMVTPAHHGQYSNDPTTLCTYDFSNDNLSPNRERETLLAISFIEEWDKLTLTKNGHATIENLHGKEQLDTITATRWKNHRNLKITLKSNGYFLLNIIKGVLFSRHPWEEEAWSRPDFHLFATKLRQHALPNEPLIKKPYHFIKGVFNAVKDLWQGIRDFGANLVIRLPRDILNDWASTAHPSSLENVLTEATAAVKHIQDSESERLQTLLEKCHYATPAPTSKQTSLQAQAEYALTAGEQNDFLTAFARGINEFAAIFSHNLYAKDPVSGILFTAGYAAGAAAIFLPKQAAQLFGEPFVKAFSDFSYSMASSPLGAAISGGSTLGQGLSVAEDLLLHGPSSIAINTIYELMEDPLTAGTYFLAAYGIGYVLANGINGHPIPWISDHIKSDLGTKPELGYPLFGAKFGLLGYESFHVRKETEYPKPMLSAIASQSVSEERQHVVNRFSLIVWLTQHAKMLPKLESNQKFKIERQIEQLFTPEETHSLKQLLYPESRNSIAFQFFSLPLSYIPAILRVVVAFIFGIAAFCFKNPTPFAPIKRAMTSLFDKSKRDLSRLVKLLTYTLYLPYDLISSLLKATAYTITMLIGRIAGIFDFNPAHYIHQAFSKLHVAIRRFGEWCYPAKALKSVAIAHPTHTIRTVEQSYTTLMGAMLRSTAAPEQSPGVPPPYDAKPPLTPSAIAEGSLLAENGTASNNQLSHA
jgi:hypothetical protein